MGAVRAIDPSKRAREGGLAAHFFFSIDAERGIRDLLPLAQIVDDTVTGMGYELVEVAFAPRGLLRVFIDGPEGVRIEDCARVSRQLSHVLTVENADYQRLEVSSPGLDRPLKRLGDYERFVGHLVALKLRRPFEGRSNFTGVLVREADGAFGLDLVESTKPPAKAQAARAASPKKARPDAAASGRRLNFSLDEVERARLVPNLAF